MVEESCCQPMFWIYAAISIGLVLFAGLMSGLTLGLMSLSQIDLEVLSKSGQPEDRKNAAKILPVVKNQHLLLCTLLLGNSLAMEALPIFLDSLVPAWGAVIISVTLILAFGEIIPQAVCSRYGLSIGAKMVVVVRILLVIFFPITYPISKLLDWLLGKGHFALLRRAELKTLVDIHGNAAGKGGELTYDETTIIAGALDLTQKTAKDAMTPISKIFSLDINSKLDLNTMDLITAKGHSRVPIYSGSPNHIIGLILVKNLMSCRPEDEMPVRNATIRRIPRVPDHLPLYEILNEFQEGHSHMAVVVKGMKDATKAPENTKGKTRKRKHSQSQKPGSDSSVVLEVVTESLFVDSAVIGSPDPNLANLDSFLSYSAEEEVIGIITMEDVIEELLQEEIYDETDEYIDVHNKIRINMLPRKSSTRSPRTTILSNLLQRTPVVSPLHQTLVSYSPAMSPYVQSPAPRPSVSNFLGNHLPTSPPDVVSPGRSSLFSNQVPGKP